MSSRTNFAAPRAVLLHHHRAMHRPPLLLTLALAAATGCVTKTKYDALARDLETARAGLTGERDAARDEAARCGVQLGDATARADACEQRLAARDLELQQQAAAARAADLARQDLEADLREAQEQLARVLKDKARLGASIDDMKSALAAAAAREREAQKRVAEFKEFLARFKSLIDAGKLQVRIVEGRMVLTLPMDILFASGSAKLSKEGHQALLELGRGLAGIPERRFQVEGHTDDVPIKTATYPSNWELAAARSLGVVRALLEAGLAPDRVSAASYSEYRPRVANDGDTGRAANRRIEIVVVPDLTGLPGYDELVRLAGGG